ncbi:Asp23/Gls24 family envelope stress response protein [Streptomyces heliomycini]
MTDMTEGGSVAAPAREKDLSETTPRKDPGTRRGGGDPATRGRTTIADGVVERSRGWPRGTCSACTPWAAVWHGPSAPCATGCPAARRAATRGVKAEVGEVQTALDLEIVIDYGVSITDVAKDVRENVIAAVERMTGLEVVEVNIAVSDVKLPEEEDEEPETRLQ